MTEILDLPKLPDEIKQAINDKKLAIFIGAGLSRFFGCESWGSLAKKLVQRCKLKGLINHLEEDALLKENNKVKLISICHNILKEKDFMDEMKKALKDDKVNKLDKDDEKLKIYNDLYCLSNTFITTNADRFIDKLFNKGNIYSKSDDLIVNKISNNSLYKIHGCISDEDSLVFTTKRYIEIYTNAKFNEFIEEFFNQYTVLFVGYGLEEIELLERIFKSTHTEQKFYLRGYFEHEKRVVEFEKKYFGGIGVNVIPFSKDKNGYEQLKVIIGEWKKDADITTYNIQNSFADIDDALENPSMSNITKTIQYMESNENQAHYFFSKAHSYKNLHLWLEPLLDADRLTLYPEKENNYLRVLSFLEAVSIQNKEDEKPKITKRLLFIARQIIKTAANQTIDDHIIWTIVKVIFNLPIKKITLKHIKFIDSHIRKCKYRSILNHDLTKIVLPVLIENEMPKHLLKLLPLIFGYKPQKDALSHIEPISIIEEYNLQKILKMHSQDMVKLVGLDGLKIVIKLIKDIAKKEESMFNPVWLTVIRTQTADEIKQNQHGNRYDNQLIFFTRDLFESLPSIEIKPFVKDFLLKQKHPIFIRLALHIINYKYADLKDIFWQWMDSDVKYERRELELWTLLNESSENFSNDEFDKIIDWIETLDCKEYRSDESDEAMDEYNAYKRKEWLLCLKDNSKKAKKLYQEYDLINSAESEHPGFSYWSSGVHFVPEYSLNSKKFRQDPIKEIQNFDPSTVKNKSDFDSDEYLKRGVANDLLICIKNDPARFETEIGEFKNLENVYKDKIILGFANAWEDKKKFDWGKVLNFIGNELSPDFFSSSETEKQWWFVAEIANLIECGTKEDSNAFDKKHLPKVKEILLKLLDNKYEENESDTYSNLSMHVLNSPNGKVLHALIIYTLRYGRLNSSSAVKWEPEIKKFFTNQLEQNNTYSKSVFTILGTYLHQLQFLDKQWVIDNFNKIFPLENKQLWEASIAAYLFHTNTVYKETYNLFKKNRHLQEMLLTDFEENGNKSRLISFVCIAYINNIDKTIFDIIDSKNQNNILEIVRSILQMYRNEKDKNTKEMIKVIWEKIYNTCKDDKSKNAQKIFRELCDWFVFLDKIAEADLELLKYTVSHSKGDYQSYGLMEEMARLSSSCQSEIAKIYKYMLGKGIYPTYRKEDIAKILGNLNDSDSLRIKNHYRQKGIYDFEK